MISMNRQKAKNIANNILSEDLQYRGSLFCVLSQYFVWFCDDKSGMSSPADLAPRTSKAPLSSSRKLKQRKGGRNGLRVESLGNPGEEGLIIFSWRATQVAGF